MVGGPWGAGSARHRPGAQSLAHKCPGGWRPAHSGPSVLMACRAVFRVEQGQGHFRGSRGAPHCLWEWEPSWGSCPSPHQDRTAMLAFGTANSGAGEWALLLTVVGSLLSGRPPCSSTGHTPAPPGPAYRVHTASTVRGVPCVPPDWLGTCTASGCCVNHYHAEVASKCKFK